MGIGVPLSRTGTPVAYSTRIAEREQKLVGVLASTEINIEKTMMS